MKRRHLGTWALTLGILEPACFIPAPDVGALPGGSGDAGESETSTAEASSAGSLTASDGSDGGPPAPACGPAGPACEQDQDRDCVGLEDDNAPGVYNPDQRDIDEDGFVDEVDACPTVPSASQGDSDRDGLGNACDPCRRLAEAYRGDVPVSDVMRIRNVPSADDADGDGIGDTCDNCIHVPNCEGYGPGAPWQPGDPIADGDPGLCQGDADDDLVGDACEGLAPLPGAAGGVGLGNDDDFDQDGLSNLADACPRAVLADAITCATDDDCPAGRQCEPTALLCNHADVDADGVGDVCDSCASVTNPEQLSEAAIDDADGDFRGDACELGSECSVYADPDRVAFFPVAASGWCCTTAYPGDDVIFDPDGVPLRLACSDEQEAAQQCRRLPPVVASTPGVVSLPAGCELALADAGLTVETNLPLDPDDVGGLPGLWPYECKVLPLDQDFDGLGDACDLCEFAFDPENLPYVDAAGTLWPDDGKYCNGPYAIENVCMG